ncbi:CHAD domain-containing protein [Neorhizobium sp. NCHU2750]|uniref:CHAD domain-containing protein n=1 Tax=Neorhizobium sp. NCHU2750 TaxID=1825976 RepID=UPI000E77243A|nr:metal-binding protein [Neorhizobium sp. NCHU2750]
MAYRLRPAEPFTAEVRAVARDQLAKAIDYLEHQPDGPHEAIHDARKRFKRVRALYRLIEPGNPDFQARENARIRDIAQSLSAVRDATALVETVHYLAGFTASPEESKALQIAHDALAARRDRIATEEHDLPARMLAAAQGCREAMAALDQLELPDAPRKTARLLGRAWRKHLRKAHSALDACNDHGNAETYHDLRKCGQTYWMHLSLLRDIWPSAMLAKQAECKTLIDLLGHEHDLSVLTAAINEQPGLFGNGDTLARLLAAIINRQQILRRKASDLAHEILAERAEVESSLIDLLWQRAAKAPAGKQRGNNRNAGSPQQESALRSAR